MGMFKKKRASAPKLKLSAFGEKIYNGMLYSVSIENCGAESTKGFCLSIAGDAVDNGGLTVKKLQIHRIEGIKATVKEIPFVRVEKKSGGIAFMARAENEYLPYAITLKGFEFPTEKRAEELMVARLQNEISLKFVCSYTDDIEREVLITVFPFENVLTGADCAWKKAAKNI